MLPAAPGKYLSATALTRTDTVHTGYAALRAGCAPCRAWSPHIFGLLIEVERGQLDVTLVMSGKEVTR